MTHFMFMDFGEIGYDQDPSRFECSMWAREATGFYKDWRITNAQRIREALLDKLVRYPEPRLPSFVGGPHG